MLIKAGIASHCLFLRNLQLFSYYKHRFSTVVAISMAGTFLWTVFIMCALDLPAMNMIMQCSMIITLLWKEMISAFP